MKEEIIPIMHCFNNNYVIPAAVSFQSMLENAASEYKYALYVLHDDIIEENRKKLERVVSKFPNASLEFINMKGRFSDLYRKYGKDSFSKEMFYKFLPPTLFPQFDKIIITDVDVIFEGDVSREFNLFDVSNGGGDEKVYIAGASRHFKYHVTDFSKGVSKDEDMFLKEVLAGYMLLNLKKMREDSIETTLIDYAYRYARHLGNPEQQVFNEVCYPNVKVLPPNTIVSGKTYAVLRHTEDSSDEMKLLKKVSASPFQIHFSEYDGKVWSFVSTPKFILWLSYLEKTPFYSVYVKNVETAIRFYDKSLSLFRIKIPFRERYFNLFCTKLKEVRETKVLSTNKKRRKDK